MSTNQPDPTPPKGGGLWARLFGMSAPPNAGPEKPKEKKKDRTTWSGQAPPATLDSAATMESAVVDPIAAAFSDIANEPKVASASMDSTLELPASGGPLAEAAPAAPAEPCPACAAPRKEKQAYCDDCGWMFSNGPLQTGTAPAENAASAPAPAAAGPVAASSPAAVTSFPKVSGMRIKDRFEIGKAISERSGVARFSGLDHFATPPLPVVVILAAVQEIPEAILPLEDDATLGSDDEIMPTFDDTLPAAHIPAEELPPWPSVTWEAWLLARLGHPGLPKVVEIFREAGTEYLIEEQPQGTSLWDAWDDPTVDAKGRYGWLKQIANTLQALHKAGVVCESLRPDLITVTAEGQAVLNDLGELLPVPVPMGTAIRATLYTAPELVLTPEKVDSRADLYSFGAMLYALEYLHHGLEEKDFERQFSPKLITDRFPDVHPGFFRLVSKTFNRDVNSRFPTDEAIREDRTGFTELIRTLEVCQRTFDTVRLDFAAWTTTGMVRTGNEDAFSFLHGMESRQDELTEYAMVLLADGMGGYDAGEVAAALCLQSMKKYLLQQAIFSSLAGAEAPLPGVFTIEGTRKVMLAALKHANKEVYTAARTPGKGKRGMGCTAECVYVDNSHVVVGHVGDSRTYHLHEGRLVQLTRDQTLVNRLVELGQLTPQEAESHPRKNELQQAIGGQPDVEPGLYHGFLKRGDWVLVCSDGLTNHIPAADLTMMLTREAMSAEDAARRLMNLVNLRGATDNATIVVIRAT